MNSDDIAVWFCLAGSNYNSTYKNDGVNAYYIYNRGNVTYSGAGHNPQGTTTDEAKLFINTMIAAYRSAAVNPEINFRSAEDTAVSTQFVPMEYANAADATSAAGTAAENAKIFFKISDANLSADKQVRVALYYKLGDLTLTDEQRAALTTAGEIPQIMDIRWFHQRRCKFTVRTMARWFPHPTSTVIRCIILRCRTAS